MLTIAKLLSLALSLLLVISVLSLVVIATDIHFVTKVYAHFIGGDTKTIDNYQILFLLSPSRPIVGDNSTKLNFSVLDKDQNTDVKSVFAALTIKEKIQGKSFIKFHSNYTSLAILHFLIPFKIILITN